MSSKIPKLFSYTFSRRTLKGLVWEEYSENEDEIPDVEESDSNEYEVGHVISYTMLSKDFF